MSNDPECYPPLPDSPTPPPETPLPSSPSPPPSIPIPEASKLIEAIVAKLQVVADWLDNIASPAFIPARVIVPKALLRLKQCDTAILDRHLGRADDGDEVDGDEDEGILNNLRTIKKYADNFYKYLEPVLSPAGSNSLSENQIYELFLPVPEFSTSMSAMSKGVMKLFTYLGSYGESRGEGAQPYMHRNLHEDTTDYSTFIIQPNHHVIFSELAERIASAEDIDSLPPNILEELYKEYDNKLREQLLQLAPPENAIPGCHDGPVTDTVDSHDIVLNHALTINQTVHQTLAILRLFQPYKEFSAPAMGWIISTLAVNLFKLELYDDAGGFAHWGTKIYAPLLSTRDGNTFHHHLAVGLLNLARCEMKVSNSAEAESAIGQCITVCQDWSMVDEKPQARYLLARAMITSSSRWSQTTDFTEHRLARDLALGAVSLYETLLDAFDEWQRAVGSQHTRFVVDKTPPPKHQGEEGYDEAKDEAVAGRMDFGKATSAYILDRHPPTSPQIVSNLYRLVHDYGRALHQLSYSYHDLENANLSAFYQRKALRCFLLVQEEYPQSNLEVIAEANYHLAQPFLRRHVDPEDVLIHGREAIAFYHHLCQRSKTFGLNYYNSHWEHAMFLGSIGQYDQALHIWYQMGRIAQEIMLDPLYLGDAYRQMGWTLRRLKRHVEAIECRKRSVEIYHAWLKPTSHHEADGFHDLSVEFHMAEMKEESFHASIEAVGLYRILVAQATAQLDAVGGPGGGDAWTRAEEHALLMRRKLGEGLSQLTFCNVTIGDLEEALDRGEEALEIFKSLCTPEITDESIIPAYIYALRVCSNAAFQASNDVERCLALSVSCVEQFKMIYNAFPEKGRESLSGGLSTHGFNLNKHQRALEAIQWTEESLKWYEQQPLAEDIHVTDTYIATLINIADDLANIGRLTDAKHRIQEAIAVGEKYCEGQASSVPFVICALHNLPEIHLDFGEYEEALSTSLVAVDYARKYGAETEDETQLSGALMVQGTVLSRMGRFEEALAIANESLRVCEGAKMEKIARTNMFAPLQLARSLRGLSEMYADMAAARVLAAGNDCGGDLDADQKDLQTALEFAISAKDKCLAIRANKDYALPVAFSDVVFNYCRYTLGEVLAVVALASTSSSPPSSLSSSSSSSSSSGSSTLAPSLREAYDTLCDLARDQRELAKVKPGNYPKLVPAMWLLAGMACSLGMHDEGRRWVDDVETLTRMLKEEMGEVGILADIEREKEGQRPNQKRLWALLDLTCGHLHGHLPS